MTVGARLRPYALEIAIATAAIALAVTFAIVTMRHNRGVFGLPIEDSYIYLTYAKQFGRGEPFTYFSGGGYSAGSTSVLWPITMAPFWTLGARGHALVWVSFGLCTALYAATCVAVFRLARLFAGPAIGVLAAVLVIATGPFAFTSLAGMEVAFASALLLGMLLLLARQPHTGPPTRLLGACLAAVCLSRPEATLIAVLAIAVAVIQRVRARELRAAAWWLAPLVPLLAWLTANRVLAGHWFPNTGVVKSHFYQPGFDWTYWWGAVTDLTKQAFLGLFVDAGSPFAWPLVICLAFIAGGARVIVWGRRTDRRLVASLAVASPVILVLAVIGSSGEWSFHNFRYIAPAFPLFLLVAACALAPVARIKLPAWGHAIVVAVVGAAYVLSSVNQLRTELNRYAQNAADLDRQVVTIGRYVHDKLPDASLMLHDAGAIAYYGDGRVFDMLGLISNHQAKVANHGPGARFEFLEALPEDQRPTHFAYYPQWMGQYELFGEVLLRTPLTGPALTRHQVGSSDMQLIEATWDHVHTAERPLLPHPGRHVADRLDIADVANEDAHHWSAELGRRRHNEPTARWSVFHREVSPELGLLADGGRTIRGQQHFELTIDPTRPVKLVLRTGGNRDYDYNESITRPATLTINVSPPATIGSIELVTPVPADRLVDIEIDLPHGNDPVVEIDVTTTGVYRAFHWFALQPD